MEDGYVVIARDTTHAAELKKLIEGDDFTRPIGGNYKDKVIQVDSSQRGEEKIEIKAENQMASPEVQNKKKAAVIWCGYASEHRMRFWK